MTNVKLFADSACDLSQAEIQQLDIHVVPLTISIDHRSFQDGTQMNAQEMIAMVHQTAKLPQTSAPSPFEFEQAFRPYVEQGIPVLYIGISEALSCTLANAKVAALEFPEGAIYVVNSMNVSGALGALLRIAYRMKTQDLPLAEIVETLQRIAPHYKLFFTVDKLDFLHKSGRCGGLSYLLGSVLGVKPMIQMYPEGLKVWKKARGLLKALSLAVEEAEKDAGHILFDEIHIASVLNDVKQRQALIEKLKRVTGVSKFFEYDIGCTLASHCGESAIGFGYFIA